MFLRVHLRQFLGTPSSPTADAETNERFRSMQATGEGATASDAEPSATEPREGQSAARHPHTRGHKVGNDEDDDETF